ncbi:MAG: class I SAM-dependent methyltransferase [Bryobacteraceae bacterium]
MPDAFSEDLSHGYEQCAETFMRARNPRIGPAVVLEWSKTLPSGAAILDLGCGHGVPISQSLMNEGFDIYGMDASATLLAAFRRRFPQAHAACEAAPDSTFFDRTFDAAIAWGLLFLLPPTVQETLIHKAGAVLNAGGRFLFTSPREAVTWCDALTGRMSVSLGAERYRQILRDAGLATLGEARDEGENHYYFAGKF